MTFCSAVSLIASSSSSRSATDGTDPGFSTASSRGVNPMMRSNGDFLVVSLGHMLCEYSAIGSHLCQSSCLSSHQNRRYCSSHWLVRSDCPSVRGWYAVDMFWCILRDSHSPLANFDVNLVSLSEMIFLGTPNRGNTCRRYSPATPSAVMAS